MNLELFRAEFARNFTERGDLGAAVSVWKEGREVVSLAGGFQDREQKQPWGVETPVLFWSATKGLAAACLLHVCQEHGIGLERCVADFWPGFAAEGKGGITLAELLSHRAGLSALSKEVPVVDHAAVVQTLASQPPQWPLGSGHGYHPQDFWIPSR